MRDAVKSIYYVEPSNRERLRLAAGIIDSGVKEECMFIAAFTFSCTILLGGEEVVRFYMVRHSLRQEGH